MELRQLQYFLIIAQELSFAKASKKAFVSQQALSKSILSLEKELGVPLFRRSPHGVELTEYGVAFKNQAYHISSAVNDAIIDIKNLKMNLVNTIQLAITSGIEESFKVKDLLTFQSVHPDYRISTVTSNDVQIEEWLYWERLELGLVGAKGGLSELEYTELRKCDTILAVHKTNPLSERESVMMEDLRNECFLVGTSDYYAYNRLIAACNLSGYTPDILHQSVNAKYLAQLVENNQGIILFSHIFADRFNLPNVRHIRIEDDPNIFFIHFVTKKNKVLSEGACLLKEFILNGNVNANNTKNTLLFSAGK